MENYIGPDKMANVLQTTFPNLFLGNNFYIINKIALKIIPKLDQQYFSGVLML